MATTAYVRAQGRAPNGVAADVSFKAWVPSEQSVSCVKWDLVRVSLSLHVGGPGRLPFHKWWLQKRPGVMQLWSDMGVAESEYIPSSRSAGGEHEEAKDVPTLSSKALIYFLLFMSSTSRLKEDQSRALAALFGWLAQCLPSQEIQSQQWIEQTFSKPGLWRSCVKGQPASNSCPHMMAVRKDGFRDEDPVWALVRLSQHLFSQRSECNIMKECLQNVCRETAALIDPNVEQSSYTLDPTKADEYKESGKKRRRIDEDYKRAATSTVIQTGRASSSSTFLRADGVVEGKRAAEWEEKELLHEQAAMWIAVQTQPVDVVVIAADAGRFGQPAEDTLVSACEVWGAQGNSFAAWLPPQVLLGKDRCRLFNMGGFWLFRHSVSRLDTFPPSRQILLWFRHV